MEETRMPRHRVLLLVALAALIALVWAVSSWAADGSPSTGAAQSQAQPVQYGGAAPSAQSDQGQGGQDCPEHDGSGGSSGGGGGQSESPSPAAPSTTPDV